MNAARSARIVIGVTLLYVLIGAGGAHAMIDVTSYQGYLTDGVGEPVDGILDITYLLYDAPIGGTPLWSEMHGSVAVDIIAAKDDLAIVRIAADSGRRITYMHSPLSSVRNRQTYRTKPGGVTP